MLRLIVAFGWMFHLKAEDYKHCITTNFASLLPKLLRNTAEVLHAKKNT
jgi:hypothetical protein